MTRRELLQGLVGLSILPRRPTLSMQVRRVVAENGFGYPVHGKGFIWLCSDWTGGQPWPFIRQLTVPPSTCRAYLLYGAKESTTGVICEVPVGFKLAKEDDAWQVVLKDGSTSWQCQNQNQ